MGMAPFALRHRIGTKGIKAMFDIHYGTPWRHYSWFWWQCLTLSGMEHLWFADDLNSGKINLATWVRRFISKTTDEEEELLLKRFYRPVWYERHAEKKVPGRRKLWTKGGIWSESHGMAKILVLHQHLEREGPSRWEKILKDDVKNIERELRKVADPNRYIFPEAYFKALDYVRARANPLGRMKMSDMGISWFFQQDICRRDGMWIRRSQNYRLSRKRGAPITW